MLLFIVGIGFASVLMWLLKLYIYGGWSKMPGHRNRNESIETLFPPRSKLFEEELDRRRKLAEERKAAYDRGDGGDVEANRPRKNFLDEAEEYIAKRKMEAQERKWDGKRSCSSPSKYKKRANKHFEWLHKP